jgi:hypothetical protein
MKYIMPSLEPIKGKISCIQGIIIIQIKISHTFRNLAIPNSGIDVHHLPTPASQHQ